MAILQFIRDICNIPNLFIIYTIYVHIAKYNVYNIYIIYDIYRVVQIDNYYLSMWFVKRVSGFQFLPFPQNLFNKIIYELFQSQIKILLLK